MKKKDLQPLIKSKEKFETIITDYPNTDYEWDYLSDKWIELRVWIKEMSE